MLCLPHDHLNRTPWNPCQDDSLQIEMQTMLVTDHLLDKICSLKEGVNRPVIESVLTLALEIAHEGRRREKGRYHLHGV